MCFKHQAINTYYVINYWIGLHTGRHMRKTLLTLLVGANLISSVSAESLYQVYQQALDNDPATLQSKADRDAAFIGIKRSRADLFPQISGSLSASRIGGDRDRTSQNANIRLSQSIYDHSNWVALNRAELVASRADTLYARTLQDLIVRIVNNYFNTLQAQDDLEFAKAEKRAIERQLEQTKQRFEVGLTAITDVHEAQAQFDTAVAREISAENSVETNLEALREITGRYYPSLHVLNTETFSASMPAPASVEQWLKDAEQFNLQLVAANAGVDIAKYDIKNARASLLPTVNFSATVDSSEFEDQTRLPQNVELNPEDPNNVDNITNITQTFDTYQLGVSVSVPIFAGGRLRANVDSAKANFISQSEDRERIKRQVIRSVRSNFNDIKASIARIRAFEQAVLSAESALEATEAGFDVGTRTIVDVLDSTRNLFDARRNLASVRYGYVTSVMNLKFASGKLSEQDIQDIDSALVARK
jgi:outer membrane protein